MYDPHTRESRGFGFVTMETAEEAEAAITALNSTELMGKIMNVEKVFLSDVFFSTYADPLRNRHAEDVLGLPLLVGTMALRNATSVCRFFPPFFINY
jgi:RNA recognition motif-containing protein